MNDNNNSKSEESITDTENLVVSEPNLLPISISNTPAKFVDGKIVSLNHVNSFNFSKLATHFNKLNLSIGITSATRREGKTRVATNMAVSLAKGYKCKTLLVDMNFQNPQLHKIFGTKQGQGVAEALRFEMIRVVPTTINNLFLMPTGDCKTFRPDVDNTLTLRDMLYALKNEFDFVIIDMCSVLPIKNFPIHFINEIDGLISVVDVEKTKTKAFNRIFKHLDEKRFIGYIFNNTD